MTYSRTKRSLKAKNQARDRFGRWVSVGANVKWVTNGEKFAGVIDKIEDGKAQITVHNNDGTKGKTTVLADRLRVLASKATIPPKANTFKDPHNNFSQALKRPEVQSSFNEDGTAKIEREDGYSLTMSEKKPKDDSNPIIFQLFAPSGRSLGQYGVSAETDFDQMVSEDQTEGPEAPDNAKTTPEPAPVVVDSQTKAYTVPAQVRGDVREALMNTEFSISEEDLVFANNLANESQVSIEEIKWIDSFFSSHEVPEKIHGGFKGKKWSSSILNPPAEKKTPDFDFNDEILEFFAVSQQKDSYVADSLYALDREAERLYKWDSEFSLVENIDIDSFEAPTIIELSVIDAQDLAKLFSEGVKEFNVLDIDPVERNLFALAEDEMDMGLLDLQTAVIADATGYSPIERSVNAKKQHRGPGGKFGQQRTSDDGTSKTATKKAVLPVELPLVTDPKARIAEWISTAPEAPVMASADEATGPTDEALYFAIVDDVDKTAVLDAVAIVKIDGAPSAYVRSGAAWKADANTLADLQGTTPPPVVELDVPEPVKTVLAQIDQHDQENPVTASAIESVDDLKSVVASVSSPTLEQKQYIRKRAHALNRMDVIPSDWRTLSVIERGILASAETLYGEYGEIIPVTAGGVPGIADTPGDWKNAHKLRAYWTHGKGALKIRWGTPGDLTRARKHLEKYVPGRGWALAQSYHKHLFGVSNIVHDRATGQYRPRGRK